MQTQILMFSDVVQFFFYFFYLANVLSIIVAIQIDNDIALLEQRIGVFIEKITDVLLLENI